MNKRTEHFYSQLGRGIANAPDKVFSSGPQVAAWVSANAAKIQIKKDELYWTGILDWLNTLDVVNKADVLAYLDGNGIQVNEVILGGSSDELPTTYEELTEEMQKLVVAHDNGDLYISEFADKALVLGYTVNHGMDGELESIVKNDSVLVPTQYSSHQLPGGMNYRELLLTLPIDETQIDGLTVDGVAKALGYSGWRSTLSVAQQGHVNQVFDGQINRPNTGKEKRPDTFKTRHFAEFLNVLVHVRFNERVDGVGKKLLFIEELQSDWGQSGKKNGFDTAKVVVNTGDDAEHKPWKVGSFTFSDKERADEYAKGEQVSQTPSGPFVTDTKSWTALALKRVIAYAVENGYHKVAWTNGEQQADRYDLSRQVEYITYKQNSSNDYVITVTALNGDAAWDKEHATLTAIEETVGKDIAAKIRNGEGADRGKEFKRLSGMDLKVGSEGMKGYYDQIVPQVANDILKKMGGGKVETVGMTGASNTKAIQRDGEFIGDYQARKKAADTTQQQGFSLTPELRAKVLNEGLPLFSIADNSPSQGITIPAIEQEIKRLQKQWLSMPNVTVVNSVDELPFDAPARADGLFHEGQVYVVAGNISDLKQVQKVMVHECVLHHSLEEMLGYYGFAKLHSGVHALKLAGDPVVSGLASEVFERYGELSAEDETKEIVARAGERCLDETGNIKVEFAFMKSVFAAVASWLRDHDIEIPFTNFELQGILHDAGEWIHREHEVQDPVRRALRVGLYSGKVVDVKNGIVTQKTGRDPGELVGHDVSKLSHVPVPGEVADIRYKGGMGSVSSNVKEHVVAR